jgi:hypothetical protein
VIGGVWTALTHPWVFLCLLGLFLILLAWLLPKIWRGVKKVFGFLVNLFSGKKQEPEPDVKPPSS